jgi:hypothetical protein
MTGAKENLHLVGPQRLLRPRPPRDVDRHLYASRTPFTPEKLIGLTAWPVVPAGSAAQPTSQGPSWISAPECANVAIDGPCGGGAPRT